MPSPTTGTGCSAASHFLEAARRVLVQQARDQRLIRQALRERPLLDRLQILARQPDVQPPVLAERGLRVTGVPGALAFAANDPNAGKKPAVAAGAYTNSMAGARETALYNIDPMMGTLLLQSPPNDGVQQTKGSLGLKLKPTVAFDIMADGSGRNVAYALADKTLYTVDLASGKATRLRDIKKLPALIDIAVLPAK